MPINPHNIQDELVYDNMNNAQTVGDEITWRPIRPLQPIPWQGNQILQLQSSTSSSTNNSSTPTPGTGGLPENLISVAAVQSPTKGQNQTLSLVSVTWINDPSDPNFAGVNIWFTGYKGSSNPTLVASGTVSPVSFVEDTTGETVVVTVQPYSFTGATLALSTCLTCTVALNGVTSAPPPPSIAQGVITTPTGLQFSFNQEGGLLADVIQSYNVYQNTSNTSTGATIYKTYPQNPTNTGQVVVSETLPNGTIEYYWVSAVNTSGLESTLTAVSGSGIPSGYAPTSDNMVRNGDFSGGQANWSGIPVAAFLQNQTGIPVGNTCMYWTAAMGFGQPTADDYIPVDPTKSYLVSCWAQFDNNNSGVMYAGFAEYDDNKNLISHVSGGAFECYCLYSNINRTSQGQFSDPSTNGWQYFEGIVNGPPVSSSSAPGPPGIYQFAAGTCFIRPAFLFNDTGTAQGCKICGVRISKVEAVTIQSYIKASGINLIANSDFVGGSSSGYTAYDNNATGNVSISVVTNSTAPNSTGKVLQISTASGAAPSPGLGGFLVGLGVDSGTVEVGAYHKGDQILVRIQANIPNGYTLHYATNAFGNEGTVTWLRSQAGRGVWYEYLLLITIGVTGTFSSIGFFWLSNELSAPVTWQVATFEMIDLNQVQLTGNNYQLYRQGISTSLITQGSIIPTQAFTITYSASSVGTISTSWGTQTLFRSDGSTFTIPSGILDFMGLSNSTTYYLYPYLSLSALTVLYSNGSPPPTNPSTTFSVEASFDGRVGLQPFSLTTANSGGTGGGSGLGGGGGGTCPEENELIEIMRNGTVMQIKVGDVVAATDLIKGHNFTQNKNVYRRILHIEKRSCAAWRIVQGHKVTPCEQVYVNNTWMPAYQASSAQDTSVGIVVHVTVEADEDKEHNYYVVGGTPLLIHNFYVLPC